MPSSRKRYLVTGASRGLGLEFTRQLLARGHRVVATCRDPSRADALAALASAHSGALDLQPFELTDAGSRASLLAAVTQFDEALDGLINNAGVLPPGDRSATFGRIDAGEVRDTFEANAIAPLLLTQALAPLLAKGREPVVAFLSSKLGSIASTSGFYTPAYAMAKAALNMGARQAAVALGELGIRSVLLHPGWVRTDMGGSQAPLEASESVRRMLAVIDALPANARAPFFDFRGETLPW